MKSIAAGPLSQELRTLTSGVHMLVTIITNLHEAKEIVFWVAGPTKFYSWHLSFSGGGGKKPININNFAGLSRKWVGVKLFMCFPFPGVKGKHINIIPRKSQEKAGTVPGQSQDSPGIIPGQSREHFVYVFLVYWFFPGPTFYRINQLTLSNISCSTWFQKQSIVVGLSVKRRGLRGQIAIARCHPDVRCDSNRTPPNR